MSASCSHDKLRELTDTAGAVGGHSFEAEDRNSAGADRSCWADIHHAAARRCTLGQGSKTFFEWKAISKIL